MKLEKDKIYTLKGHTGELLGELRYDGCNGDKLIFKTNCDHFCIIERDKLASAKEQSHFSSPLTAKSKAPSAIKHVPSRLNGASDLPTIAETMKRKKMAHMMKAAGRHL